MPALQKFEPPNGSPSKKLPNRYLDKREKKKITDVWPYLFNPQSIDFEDPAQIFEACDKAAEMLAVTNKVWRNVTFTKSTYRQKLLIGVYNHVLKIIQNNQTPGFIPPEKNSGSPNLLDSARKCARKKCPKLCPDTSESGVGPNQFSTPLRTVIDQDHNQIKESSSKTVSQESSAFKVRPLQFTESD